MHTVHHRQERISGAMNDQGRQLQAFKHLDPARLRQYRQQLPLHPQRIKRPVVAAGSLMQQERTIIADLWAAQGGE
jgi:hypothetical protein